MADQFEFGAVESPYCATCPFSGDCGDAFTSRACQDNWGKECMGGPEALHPQHPDALLHMADVGGPSFSTVAAQPVGDFNLPALTPWIRRRKALRGQLKGDWYAVGPRVANTRRVVPAGEIKALVGLRRDQKVVLELFGDDHWLEAIWARRSEIYLEIARAQFDAVVAPSFSVWFNRPPLEQLFNLKRSLAFFEQLQSFGVPAIPRFAWVAVHHAKTAARWCRANPNVETVALDWGTVASEHEFGRQFGLLSVFDNLTNRRLIYLIHGPTKSERVRQLYRRFSPERIRLSSSRAIAGRPPHRGASFAQRLAPEIAAVASARRLAEQDLRRARQRDEDESDSQRRRAA